MGDKDRPERLQRTEHGREMVDYRFHLDIVVHQPDLDETRLKKFVDKLIDAAIQRFASALKQRAPR